MADAAKERRIAQLLKNELNLIGMANIAPSNELSSLIEEYFEQRDSSLSEDSEGDSDEEDSSDQGPVTRPSAGSAVPVEMEADVPSPPATEMMQVTYVGLTDYDDGDDDAHGATFVENISEMVVPGTDAIQYKEKTLKCTCKLFKGQPCHTQFDVTVIEDIRMTFLGMTREELDISILSQIHCGMHDTVISKHAREVKERKVSKTDYFFHGKLICRNFFKWLHNIGQDKLNSLLNHYKTVGIEARQHKSIKRAPKHALSFHDTKAVVDFIVNFAEVHAIMLPGRQPGHWKTNIKLLPTNVTKIKVYDAYCASATDSRIRTVSKSTFYRLWRQLIPFVSTMCPASDLCWFCQKNSMRLLRAANQPDDEKSQAVLAMQDHLEKASKERSYYQQVCEAAKSKIPVGTSLGQERRSVCSYDGMIHYSFDFAQQVHYPSNPLQPGPIFFKTPRKCGLFGVACEAIPVQVNFLLEECVSTGKGANCVVSLLHFFLEKYGMGEKHAHFHADNCCGQNKNNCMMQYLMWRVLTGRHLSIKMSFLLTGHTKFSCDWCFGLIKRKFKVTKVDCLEDIANVVKDSATCNIVQLCGMEDGEVLVPVYDWTKFLRNFFRIIPAIKKYHHFHFQGDSGTVVMKEFVDSGPVEHRMLVKDIDKNSMPSILQPLGLDSKRQWYLYDEIREFVADELKDRVAPKPSCERYVSTVASEEVEVGQEAGPSHAKVRKESKGKGISGKGKGRGKGINE